MKNRISQRDLARLAGVSAMTVSLALRGHPSISAATRDLICQLAQQHHYRPDPALAALNAYRLQGSDRQFQSTLVWLTAFPSENEWRSMTHAEGYYHGAEKRALEMGYRLEPFWLKEPGLTARRASQILLARGAQGIIVAPLPAAQGELHLDWEHFSAVTLGYSLRHPQLHVVMNHQSRNMKQTVRRLHDMGYRRIGLALPSANNDRVDQNYLSGYLIAQRETEGQRLEPLLADVFDEAAFQAWFQQEKPDAIILSPAWIERVTGWLKKGGHQVPRHIGLAAASIPDGRTDVSGVDENPELIGSMAADALIGMILRQERGVPERPWSLLAEGAWSHGETTRPQAAKARPLSQAVRKPASRRVASSPRSGRGEKG